MSLHFKGVAHPPAMRGRNRGHAADFTDTEISVTNLGRRGGTNLLYEHDPRDQVGQVTSSWQGVNGELRVSGVVHDAETIKKIKSGHSRGLSLGTSVLSAEDDTRISSSQDELSVCVEPRRAGCWVDEINGKQVRTVHRASAGETFSKQYVDDLKAKLDAKTAETATLNAKFSAHQDRQRAALKGMQSEVEGFVEDAYNMAPDEVKHEIDPMRQFAKSLGDNANPESAMPLARVICLSSGKFKRERSEFSKSSEMAEQLAEANKKIDELTSDRDGKVSRISELELLADERQAGLEKLQGVLAAKGMLQDKFDFSKATSREANASTDAPAAPSAVPREPLPPASDPLMDFLSGGSSSAGGRLMPSNTSHGFLGAVAGSSSDGGVSEALRGL